MQNYISGYASYAQYGFETTYGSVVTATRAFGHGTKITHTRRNNMERIYGLGSRNASANVAKTFEGSASIEFVLANASFFRAVLGSVADGGGGGPAYTHTYSEANTLPSLTISTGSELGTNDEVTKLLGCKVDSMTMTATQGEVVKIRLETPYKTETLATTGIGSATAETYTPFTFASGVLEWTASGGEIGKVMSFELSMNNSLEAVFGLGSRLKSAEVEKIREYNIKMTVAFKDTTELLTKFYGATGGPLATSTPAEQASMVLTLTQGTGNGSAGNELLVLTLANISLNEESLPKDVNEVMKEDVSGWARSGTSLIWTNATSADNASP